MKYIIHEITASLTLLTGEGITLEDRIRYAINALLGFAPLAFVLKGVELWFQNNSQFASFFLAILCFNLLVGAWRHFVKGTFSIKLMLVKNATMAFVLVIVFIALEMLHIVVGENIAGETFGTLIQVMTLLYPISKIVKSAFILSGGKYPPEFLMRKLYNFEKNGDLSDFFSTSRNEKEDGFDDHIKEMKDEGETK